VHRRQVYVSADVNDSAPSMVKLKSGGSGLPFGIVASGARRLCKQG
jgi:hypothetical protein